MPNTLGHLGFQGLVTRAVFRDADLKWICLGCVIPDLPWILQRAMMGLLPVDPYDLRLYAIAQSSLALCLVACGAFAALSADPGRVLRILGLNSVLHLLLDACQAKWANGVHFLAPFSWRIDNFGLFWPESPLSVLLTVTGLGWLLFVWRRPGVPIGLAFDRRGRLITAAGLMAAYFVLPVVLLSGPEAADNHSVRTLRDRENRTGRAVEFDRNRYVRREAGDVLETFAGEELTVTGEIPERSASISVQGRFVHEKTVEIVNLHTHWPRVRDLASYVGLALVALVWLNGVASRVVRGRGR